MRSLILMIVTVAVLVGGLVIYTSLQPATPGSSRKPIVLSTRPRFESGESLRGIQQGENVWIRRYDDKTGELSSQFKGSKYTPQKDGTVDVETPQAEFFSGDGKQRVRVEGVTGNVLMELAPQEDDSSLGTSGQSQMPSRGKLHDVVVSVYEPVDAATPALVARMNNAAFDTETFRISTESFTDSTGKTIDADQVPVVVRGRDYDFDGRGLVIRWNERDRKLQLLEISHGEQLVVKNPEILGKSSLFPATQPSAERPISDMLASTDHQNALALAAATPSARTRRRRAAATVPATTTTASTTQPEEVPVVYRATFERDVRILQGDQPVATVDQMYIDLLQAPDEEEASTTQPSTTSPAVRTTAPSKPKRTASKSASQPTSAPSPITVKWSGKLRVVPLDGPPDPSLTPGKAIVHMSGAPAVLHQDEQTVQCGELIFNSASETGSLLPSEKFPQVTMSDPNGMKVVTPRLDYAQLPGNRSVATMIGPSSAELPLEEKSGKREIVKTKWSKEGKLIFEQAEGETVVSEANLLGDVAVDHSQLDMKSDALSLTFDPKAPSTRPASTKPATTKSSGIMPAEVKQIVATGNVDCKVKDAKDPRQITGQRLVVTPAGEGWLLDAEGDVRTTGKEGAMTAGRLRAELAPSTKPAADELPSTKPAVEKMQLVSLTATDKVTLSSGKDTTATADKLHARTQDDGTLRYTLVGSPNAKVVSKETTLIGPEIAIQPDRNLAQIIGPGEVEGVNPDDPNQPVKITWSGGADVDGNTNLVDIDKDVSVMTNQNGGINGAKAKHLQAKLTTKPSTQPVATTAKSDPSKSMSFLDDKQISSGTLTGEVKVTSERFDADGKLLQGMLLEAEKVMYDQIAQRLEVPVPGGMLYEDNRPPTTQKTTGPTLGSGRGATAFGWRESLVYDEKQQQATMIGNVQVIHRPDSKSGQPFNLDGDKLTTTFIKKVPATRPASPASQAAATKPASNPADPLDSIEPKLLTVTGHVSVTSTRLDFDASQMTVDVQDQIITATGDERNPITLFDSKEGSTQTATYLRWNTKTDELKITGASGRLRR